MQLYPGGFDWRLHRAMVRALVLVLVDADVAGRRVRLRAVCDGAWGGMMPLSPGGFDWRLRGAMVRALALALVSAAIAGGRVRLHVVCDGARGG